MNRTAVFRGTVTAAFALVIALLALQGLLLGSMSDPAAIKKAKQTWGAVWWLGEHRNDKDGNWWRDVGVMSVGCDRDYTILGTGFNTWDAAFANYDAKITDATIVIHGPFKGTLQLTLAAMNAGVASVQMIVDGSALSPESPPTQNASIDTTGIPNGIHVLCVQMKTTEGLPAGSPAWLFSVDQNATASRTGNIAMGSLSHYDVGLGIK